MKESRVKAAKREKKKPKMKVSGKSVFGLKDIIERKTEKKKKK